MKKTLLLFILMFTLLIVNTNSIYAAVFEKGNPVEVYHQEFIQLPNNKRVELSEASFSTSLEFIINTKVLDITQ